MIIFLTYSNLETKCVRIIVKQSFLLWKCKEYLIPQIFISYAYDVEIEHRKEVWNKIRQILDSEDQVEYADAICQIIDVVRESIHSEEPIMRLWGNLGGRSTAERKKFQEIGKQIGCCFAEAGMALSCSMLNSNMHSFS